MSAYTGTATREDKRINETTYGSLLMNMDILASFKVFKIRKIDFIT